MELVGKALNKNNITKKFILHITPIVKSIKTDNLISLKKQLLFLLSTQASQQSYLIYIGIKYYCCK